MPFIWATESATDKRTMSLPVPLVSPAGTFEERLREQRFLFAWYRSGRIVETSLTMII